MRVLLLSFITWIIGFKEPLFAISKFEFSIKDLILIAGGIFLLYKSTEEIHAKVNHQDEVENTKGKKGPLSLRSAILQIVLLDIVFSFDSILTAVGMVQDNLPVMVIAVVVAMIVMVAFSGKVSDFINNNPSVKILALAFLLMIGMLLVAEGFSYEVPKGYIYFAMCFSLGVELLNLKAARRKSK